MSQNFICMLTIFRIGNLEYINLEQEISNIGNLCRNNKSIIEITANYWLRYSTYSIKNKGIRKYVKNIDRKTRPTKIKCQILKYYLWSNMDF